MNKKEKNGILYGCALGDGHITLRKSGLAFLQINHGLKQEEYLKWKARLLEKAIGQKKIKVHHLQSKDYMFNGCLLSGKRVSLWTKYSKKWMKVHKYLYKNGHKRINRYCLNRLDERGLAIWYMDDGSLNNQRIINFSTLTTDYSEHIGIQKWFKEKWDIDTKIYCRKDRGNTYYIWLNNTNSKKLIDIVAPFVLQIPSMTYKISMNYQRNRKNNLSYNLDRLSELYGNIER